MTEARTGDADPTDLAPSAEDEPSADAPEAEHAELQASLDRKMHYETFGEASSPSFPMPCWCELARSHTYSEWLDAGGPNSTGYPEHSIGGA